MKTWELIKAMEEGKTVQYIDSSISYKIVGGEVQRYSNGEVNLFDPKDIHQLFKSPDEYMIKPKRIMDLSKVKPEEIVHIDGSEVLSITEMYESKLSKRFAVVFTGRCSLYHKDGRYIQDDECVLRFKDGIE